MVSCPSVVFSVVIDRFNDERLQRREQALCAASLSLKNRELQQCGGILKIIAAIEHPTVIAKILTHLGLPIRAPLRATFAAIRSTPNGLIPDRFPLPSGSAP